MTIRSETVRKFWGTFFPWLFTALTSFVVMLFAFRMGSGRWLVLPSVIIGAGWAIVGMIGSYMIEMFKADVKAEVLAELHRESKSVSRK